jgi:serine/threonine-protein kinase
MIAAHHSTNPQAEARMLSTGLYQAIGSGLGAWLLYIALEPGVRRRWPRLLIGWTRLLAGRFRDPMVGREILIGIAAGVMAHQAFWLVAWSRPLLGQGTSYVARMASIQPIAQFAGDRLIGHVMAIMVAIGTVFFCLIATQALGRRVGFGIGLGLIALYGVYAPEAGILILLAMVAVFRSGVLTSVALGATTFFLFSAPLTLDTRAWYWQRSAAMLLIVLVLAGWAARNAAARYRTAV